MHYYSIDFDTIESLFYSHDTCIFLDTARPDKRNRYSYIFTHPQVTHTAFEYDQVVPLIEKLDGYYKNNWICGYISYEAAYAFEDRFCRYRTLQPGNLPLCWFCLFDEPLIFDHHTGKWNKSIVTENAKQHTRKENPDNNTITLSIDKKCFFDRIEYIRNAIGCGDTYQVNYTYDLLLETTMNSLALYRYLRNNQKTPYCAYLKSSFGSVASYSPELFFEINRDRIKTKPMKGTVKRGYSVQEDRSLQAFLVNDKKNRAENLMIVDLLRNDLGRICVPGSVNVKKLFEIETHPTIHQMTSTVTGRLNNSISFSQVMKNIFPCGSVTGAPKIKTMEIIAAIESGQRGVYCGTIGYFSPARRAVFSVPIRTLQKTPEKRAWRFRVGSGIVWDSTAEDEWKECLEKSRFLQYQIPEFEIIESLLYNKRFVRKSDHIHRMYSSVCYFGFSVTKKQIKEFFDYIAGLPELDYMYKFRIILNRRGELRWEKSRIFSNGDTSNKLLLSSETIDKKNVFLYHKTTYRPWYRSAMKQIQEGNCFDIVFFNEDGEITEGARSTIFIKQGDRLFTPPISCGLLAGVYRKNLLKQKKCVEKVLFRHDIEKADAVYCANSVRGFNKVFLEFPWKR